MIAPKASPQRTAGIILAALAIVTGFITTSGCSRFPSSTTIKGSQPAVGLPGNIAFGSDPQGVTSAAMAVTLMNTGKGPLTFSSNPTITGANAADFAISSSTCSTANQVAAGASCMVNVTFTPSTMSAESASLGFADNASPSTQSVSLTGTGTAPAPVVTLSPGSIQFGVITTGTTSAAMTVTVTNTGNAVLNFSSNPNITGTNAADFAILQTTCNTAASLTANASCTVQVTYTPSTAGMETATLNFADNASPSMQTVPLTGGPTSTINNSVTLTVDGGPTGGDLNFPFISVQVCAPGTTTCQTIDHIEVDTGSSGLRIAASALTITLPHATDNAGNPLGNCVQFADTTFAFGPVETADIVLAGEKASSVPIQVIAPPGFPSATSTTCEVNGNAGNNLTTVAQLGANGIIGVGLFKQDCGQACVNSAVAGFYYSCPGNSCTSTALALAKQLQNPVSMFPQDNQGVVMVLPPVGTGGVPKITGTLVFGIGTQANNTLSSAIVLTTDANGMFSTTFNGTAFPGSFIDSGSNGIFFLDTPQTGLTDCTVATNPANAAQFAGFYCPNSNSNFPFNVTNTGANANSLPASFNIVNIGLSVNANPTFAAFSDAGGPLAMTFDFGLPFFYGRMVFTGIEGQTAGGVTGPFFAYN